MKERVCHGRTKESLMKYLEKVRGTLAVDNIFVKGDKLTLDVVYKKGKLLWNVQRSGTKEIPLNELFQNQEPDEIRLEPDELEILSYRSTCQEKKVVTVGKRTVEKFVTKWWVIEPFDTVPVRPDGSIQYEEREILMDHLEDIETGVAISFRGHMYLVTKSALCTIARYMECSTLCCKYGEDTLGLCIQMAQAFENKKVLKFLVVRNENYSSLVGIIGSLYTTFDTKEYYKKLFSFMSSKGVWDVRSWMATTLTTESELEWIDSKPYSIGIAVRTPEIGESYSAYPYIRYQNMLLYLDEIKISHRSDFKKGMEQTLQSLERSLADAECLAEGMLQPYVPKLEGAIKQALMRYGKYTAYRDKQLQTATPQTDGNFFDYLNSLIGKSEVLEIKYLILHRLAAGNVARIVQQNKKTA